MIDLGQQLQHGGFHYYGAKVEYEVMLGDKPIIVEVYNPQLTERFAEGDQVHMTLIDRCVRVLP